MSTNPKRNRPANDPAYILIGLGVVFLLINILNVNFSRLWPLVPIIVGLYLLFGRHSRVGSVLKMGRFRTARAETASAEIRLHLSVGEATVGSLHDSDDLIDAELVYNGDVHFNVSGNSQRTVRLRHSRDNALRWLNPSNWTGQQESRQPWHIGLDTQTPMVLEIYGGLGPAALHLHDLNVTRLRLEGGVGSLDAYLPASTVPYTARIAGGVGEMRIQLPADTPLELDVQGGVGSIIINAEAVDGLRLESKGLGGAITLPAYLQSIHDTSADTLSHNAIWQTPDYATASCKVAIRYRPGVGTLEIH